MRRSAAAPAADALPAAYGGPPKPDEYEIMLKGAAR